MNIVDLIVAKREGEALADDEIRWFIDTWAAGGDDAEIGDEQAAALLMAVLFRGLKDRELTTWTRAMIESGTRLDLSGVGRPTVDKHSTGGVGDKVSLVLCPLVAACGAAVPQLSGRGLGHTGGTLDKLESIPGWQPDLGGDRFIEVLRDVGAAICSAGADLAPADRRMYALRDVTGTVESIPLIASSIMSKKIAEGTDALVLDIKVGVGAFMKNVADARQLGDTMIRIGAANDVRTRVLLTDMDTPLGRTAGNALEVQEAIDCLAGGGPQDLREVTLALAREMLDLAGIDADPARALDDGRALDVWNRMIRAQGGDPTADLPSARIVEPVAAPADGVLVRLDAMEVGLAAWGLGAGRARQGDPVDHAVGVVWHATVGDRVTAGTPLFTVHANDESKVAAAVARLRRSSTIADGAEEAPRTVVLDRLG